MKKSFKRILSLALVIAVLMTSMLVSSVGATTTIDPMQEVLLCALNNGFDKTGFVTDVLVNLDTKADVTAEIVTTAQTYFKDGSGNLLMKPSDVQKALEIYADRSTTHKATVNLLITSFTLEPVSASTTSFSDITAAINEEFTGNASDSRGIQLFITILKTFDDKNQTGAWATDASNTALIDFKYDTAQSKVVYAKAGMDILIFEMETLKANLDGNKDFDALLDYTEGKINAQNPNQIAEFKKFLGTYGFYTASTTPEVTPTPAPVVTPTPTPAVTPTPVATKTVDEVIEDKPDEDATGLEVNAFEKTLEAAVEKAIEAVGTTTVAPTVSGTTATITADQIKVADFLAKADAVIAKATELEKTTTGTNVAVEKKIVIDVAAKNVESVNVALPAELLTKVQDKGIKTIEIATGDVKINIAPDFAAGVKTSSSIAFSVDKVAVSTELKATMTDEQKDILAANPTVYDLSAMLTASNGTETKLTNFDKSIKIKIKYTLKAGENKDSLTVLFLGDDGKIQNMVGSYNETSGEIEFITNHFSTYVVKNFEKSFNDVTAGAWYKSQAKSLASKGIVEGIDENNFAPNANITRAEFLTMLVKANGSYDETATADFTDVSKDAWYYTYVASAVKAGITSGIGDNKFGPSSLITREQMAVMIANALGEKTVKNANSYLTANDTSDISDFAKNGMALCIKNSFIGGIGNNKLAPKSNATRGMAAVVVYKYFNFVN